MHDDRSKRVVFAQNKGSVLAIGVCLFDHFSRAVALERQKIDGGIGHHRHPIANKGVVGIIPLGALCIHPYSTLWDKIGYFRQYCSQYFFYKIDFMDCSILCK